MDCWALCRVERPEVWARELSEVSAHLERAMLLVGSKLSANKYAISQSMRVVFDPPPNQRIAQTVAFATVHGEG